MLRFFWVSFGLFFLQVFIFNGLEFSSAVYIMIYPLWVFILPFDLKPSFLFLYCFLFGFLIDFFCNGFGLHSSACISAGAARVFIFYFLSPREGYEPLSSPSIKKLGLNWVLITFSFILFVHHFWFFTIEFFNIGAFATIIKNTFFSFLCSFFIKN